MLSSKFLFIAVSLFILFNLTAISIIGQETKPTPASTSTSEISSDDSDAIRIDTNLIQTGITVLDKKGKFVDNLKQEDFELKVDGKIIKPAFFEFFKSKVVSLVSTKEETSAQSVELNSKELGRVVLFVVDDIHLDLEGHIRTKKMISNFINEQIKENDQVAIISTTGKIGFLQQFTNDQVVLNEALERLRFNRSYSSADRMNPPMSEYEALLIDRLDTEVTNLFAQQIVREIPGYDLESARMQVRSRASNILFQARTFTQQTLSVLEKSIRRSQQLPGRKTVFFLSDGFVVDPQNSQYQNWLQQITDAASRANAVIYSFDVRGLEAALPDSTSANLSTGTGFRVQSGERFELQDGMSNVAENTGGKFVFNTNDLQTSVNKAFFESAGYYLLAWEPENENVQANKLKKIEVTVKGQPDLKVQLQNGYLARALVNETNQNAAAGNSEVNIEKQLIDASRNQAVQNALPTSMVLNYLDLPNEGASLSVSLQIKNKFLNYKVEGDKELAKVDFLGVIYNSEGKQEGYFRDRITASQIDGNSDRKIKPDMLHNYQLKLKPGLYQVRVAARDVLSGYIGSAVQWINVPDINQRKLTLSSLLIGENFNYINRNQTISNSVDFNANTAGMSVDRRFSRNSNLRYLIFVYNASPEATIQTKLSKNSKILLQTNPRRLFSNEQDSNRQFYAAELPLSSLLQGIYELQIEIVNPKTKETAIRKVNFEVNN